MNKRTYLPILVLLSAWAAAANDDPPLPSGLEDPALPAGLELDEEEPPLEMQDLDQTREPLFHGFAEARAGLRLQEDNAQPSDATVAETRLQLKMAKDLAEARFEFTGDIVLDGALGKADFDLRRLRLNWSPLSSIDIQAGRQVLTWGTGDMLFVNDLFPKDWQSFFIGRDVEYLKAPSDALRIGWFNDLVNVDLVYTPQFEPDRYISGERISFWNALLQGHAGEENEVKAKLPSTWFEDDEFALRIYRNVGSSEIALYFYDGFWKSPGGQDLLTQQATFPKLSVYGASVRGTLGKAVVNAEAGYYDSREDEGGASPFVKNSELRLLLGYERELGKEFTGAFQYYLEHMMDYNAYMKTRIPLFTARDKDRHVVTARFTKFMRSQTVTLSLFTYYSPSDGDAYLRPRLSYKHTDNLAFDIGANVFLGESDTTFFGQFEANTNVYAGARYSF